MSEQIRLPSEYMTYTQPMSANLVLYKLEKVFGRPPNDEDRRLLSSCKCVEDFVTLITKTYVGDFIRGSGAGLGQLGEFYVSLRCEKAVAWESRPGYDLWGAWRYDDLVKAGKVEVKTCGSLPPKSDSWSPRISGYLSELVADVVVFVCMTASFNPCYAKLFVVPRYALVDTFNEQKARSNTRPRISISQHEINRHTKQRNSWYEFLLRDHTSLKESIGNYIHGHFGIMTIEQGVLF
jgi:hypothetical protein